MNFDEFIKKDMTRFLESMAATGGENSKAGAAEISALLNGSQQVSAQQEAEEKQKNVTIQNITNNIVQGTEQRTTAQQTPQQAILNKNDENKPKVELEHESETEQENISASRKKLHEKLQERLSKKEHAKQEHKKTYKIHDNKEENKPLQRTRRHPHHQYTLREEARVIYELFDSVNEIKNLIEKETYVTALETYMNVTEIFEDIKQDTAETRTLEEELRKIASELKNKIVSKSKIKELLKKEIINESRSEKEVYRIKDEQEDGTEPSKNEKDANIHLRTVRIPSSLLSEKERERQEYETESKQSKVVSSEPEYEQALEAIERKEKAEALKLLLILAKRHPKNIAIKTRLEQAIEMEE
ncbi:MAG: hypothetical protein ACQESE_02930 [Nanobdellota archaeon]